MNFPVDSLPASLALAAAAIVSIAGTGIAAAHAASRGRLQGIVLLAYGTGAGVLVHATIGLLTLGFPVSYYAASAALLACANTAAWIYWARCRVFVALRHEEPGTVAAALGAWMVLVVACLAISHAPAQLPKPLFDPVYVLKSERLHVRIQAITGHLPADNYVPFAVGEYLLRDIQFSKERPLLPGQEMSNRPVLMALAAVPFRAAIDAPPRWEGRLPRFDYVGTSWPDAGVVGDDRYFRQFLVVGIVLNATFLVAAALLFVSFGLSRMHLYCGLLLLVSSPYYLNQTLFTWPKALAACFVLLTFHALVVKRWWAAGGLFAALAYLSHPYAVVFAGSFGLYAALHQGIRAPAWRPAIAYAAALVPLLAAWLLWSRVYLGIPADLVAQNLGSALDVGELAWIRVHNAYTTLAPTYLAAYPLVPDQFVQQSLVSLTGIVGLFFFLQCYAGLWLGARRMGGSILFGVVLPGTLLIAVFGIPAVPALHGFQAIGPLALLFGLKLMQERAGMRALIVLVMLQLMLNVGMLYARMNTLGL